MSKRGQHGAESKWFTEVYFVFSLQRKKIMQSAKPGQTKSVKEIVVQIWGALIKTWLEKLLGSEKEL